ncbi:hypothetical protein [Thalassomonas haliotis]|uniref:Uncharacterized protein n=1 Tax=Thalassomonas haliotis TaxID=485448 RepID=A0ABY7V8M0_9GAMM|nr:hypothetical protein [Thalassomonas haliotis]WDE09944.1 hypothetical protein H3N35_16730 [Thalassomonas haliotis]
MQPFFIIRKNKVRIQQAKQRTVLLFKTRRVPPVQAPLAVAGATLERAAIYLQPFFISGNEFKLEPSRQNNGLCSYLKQGVYHRFKSSLRFKVNRFPPPPTLSFLLKTNTSSNRQANLHLQSKRISTWFLTTNFSLFENKTKNGDIRSHLPAI